MIQLAKQEQLAKFQPFLNISVFLTLEVILIKILTIENSENTFLTVLQLSIVKCIDKYI